MTGEVGKPFAALRGETEELTLYCFEETKQALRVNLDVCPEWFVDPEPWEFPAEYTPSITQQVSDLAQVLGWNPARLREARHHIEWSVAERRRNGVQEVGEAEGHTAGGSGGVSVGGDPERFGGLGASGEAGGGQDGVQEPVSGDGGREVDPGEQHPVGGGQAS